MLIKNKNIKGKNTWKILKKLMSSKISLSLTPILKPAEWSKRWGNIRGSMLMNSELKTGLTKHEESHLQLPGDPAREDIDGFTGYQPKKQLSDEVVSLSLYIKNIEVRNSMLFDQNSALSLIIDSNGTIENVNKVFLSNLKYAKSDVVGRHVSGLIIESQREAVSAYVEKNRITGAFFEFEAGIYAKDGSVKTVLFSPSPLLFQKKGKPFSTLLAGVDLTARKQAEEVFIKLEEDSRIEGQNLEDILSLDQRTSSVLDLSQLIYFVIEKATKVLHAQRCSLMLLDKETQELSIMGAKGLSERILKETRIKIGDSIAGVVARDLKPLLVRNIETDSVVSRKKRPSYKSRSFLSVPIILQNKIVGVVNIADKGPQGDGVFTKTDLKILCLIVHRVAMAMEDTNYCRKLEELSITDSLTGINNHRYFMLTLEREIERSKRYANPMCLLMFDIDNLKPYNDTYGHQEGDRAIKEISRAVKINLRTVDILCRYAGDEFVVILPETNIVQAEAIAGKIAKGIAQLKLKKEVTLSMGIAAYHQNNDENELILKTDQALYQAKKSGKGRVCCLP